MKMENKSKSAFYASAKKRYGGENIIVIEGDLFYIIESDGITFVGRKVEQDLSLSEQLFRVAL